MRTSFLVAAAATGLTLSSAASCPDYSTYSQQKHAPFSSGRYQLSYMRPDPQCRTAASPQVEQIVSSYKSKIADPDLYRLFQNSFPNTLDTAIKWTGYAANNSKEELAFIITGDINAMWLRDSANQMQSYVSVLQNISSASSSTSGSGSGQAPYGNGTNSGGANNGTDVIAKLYRGVINLQTRYVNTNPFCNSFQPPVESGVSPSNNGAADDDTVNPPYDKNFVFECKFELDSLAAFLEISHNYYYATGDAAFFGRFQWLAAVQTVLNTANAMMTPTYAADGSVNKSPYTFTRQTTAGTETLANQGLGNPVQAGTGLVRSAFRPSDDATIYQLFIPANMMFARYLNSTAAIVAQLGQQTMARQMTDMAFKIRHAISVLGVVDDRGVGRIYAYEIDGYGSRNMMDDANIPSLLSAPVFGFVDVNDQVYQRTRAKLLSSLNPYFMRGPVINAIGGPHDGPGKAWPMASIVRILTSSNDTEIYTTLKELVSSTAGLGLVHESINTFNQTDYTRQWFSWANGLFGQMIVDLAGRKPALLQRSYQ